MIDDKLTFDRTRLLTLISKFSSPAKRHNEEEIWIKKIPLLSLVYLGINRKIFKNYDSAPTLVEYMGMMRYANISKEGEDDIADLRQMGYVERLKLATSHHFYVSAYRITPKGMARVNSFDKKHHAAIDKIIKCKKCGGKMDIEARDDAPYLICQKCKRQEKVKIFDLEEISYVSKPIFSDIWLPPD